MVRGPTPPGTGVSAPATSRTDGAWTSPTSAWPFFSNSPRRSGGRRSRAWAGSSTPVHAHVDHDRARLHVLGAHEAGPSHGGHEEVGLPAHGRAGRACASGTRSRWRRRASAEAPSACPRCRCGRPRPRAGPTPGSRAGDSSSMIPAGVQANEPRPLLHQPPDVLGVEAVHVLCGIHEIAGPGSRPPARAAAAAPGCRGRRAARCTPRRRRPRPRWWRSPGRRRVSPCIPSSSQARVLLRT